MKYFLLTVSTLGLISPAFAQTSEINCTPAPDCASLGYTESSCPNGPDSNAPSVINGSASRIFAPIRERLTVAPALIPARWKNAPTNITSPAANQVTTGMQAQKPVQNNVQIKAH